LQHWNGPNIWCFDRTWRTTIRSTNPPQVTRHHITQSRTPRGLEFCARRAFFVRNCSAKSSTRPAHQCSSPSNGALNSLRAPTLPRTSAPPMKHTTGTEITGYNPAGHRTTAIQRAACVLGGPGEPFVSDCSDGPIPTM
ncbi:hypothetical protein FRC12_011786, partial [Ceratobasidium sp. 428]